MTRGNSSHDHPLDATEPDVRTRTGHRWVLALLVLVQVSFAVRLVGTEALIHGFPVVEDDYAFHLASALISRSTLAHSFRLWGYSPWHLAGYPAGAVEAASSRFGELVVALARPLSGARAFDLALLFLLLLPPATGYLAGRAVGGTSRQALWAALLLSALSWSLASEPRAYLRYGMYGFAAALILIPAAIALVVRWSEDRRPRWALLFAAVASLGALLHVFFLLLLLPAVVVAGWHAWKAGGRILAFVLAGLPPAATAVLSLWPLWEERHWLRPQAPFMRDTAAALAGELRDPRLILWLAGALGLVALWRTGRRTTALAFAASLAWALLLGAAGKWLGASALEPARFITTVAFVAVIPATVLLAVATSGRNRNLVRVAFAAYLVLPLVGWADVVVGGASLLTWNGRPSGDGRLQQDVIDLVSVLGTHTAPGKRILLEDGEHRRDGHPYGDSHLLALLPFLIHREVLGAPMPEYRLAHARVNFIHGRLFGHDLGDLSDAALSSYLGLYQIQWLVTWSRESTADLDHRPQVRASQRIGRYSLWQVRPKKPAPDPPRIHASIDRITVHSTATQTLLPYHWDPHFRCAPPLRVLRARRLDDPVGFLLVENGSVHDFTLSFRP